MPNGTPLELDFSQWDGKPFFENQPQEGQHFYMVERAHGAFLAYGFAKPQPRYLFLVRGANADERQRFLAQMKTEGALLADGTPPVETKSGGEKPPPPTGTPSGYKGGKPAPR